MTGIEYPYGPQMESYANAICDTCGQVEWSPITGHKHFCIPVWVPNPKDDE